MPSAFLILWKAAPSAQRYGSLLVSIPQVAKDLGIKSKGHSVTNAATSIYIGQDNVVGGGEVAGVNEAAKLPPELLQKMCEVLAIGIAKSIIAKSLAELQSEEAKEIAAES